MAVSILKRDIIQGYNQDKPPLGSSINWGHPLSNGLVGCWLMNEGGGTKVKELVSNNNGTIVGRLWKPSLRGTSLLPSVSTVGSSSLEYIVSSNTMPTLLTKNITIIQGYIPRSFSQTNYQDQSMWGFQVDNNGYMRFIVNTDGSLTFVRYNSSSSTFALRTTNVSMLTLNKLNIAVVSYDQSTTAANIHIYVNGIECSYATTTDGSSTRRDDSFKFVIGQMDGGFNGNRWLDGYILFNYAINRILSPQEIQSLYVSPYQFIYRPSSRIFYSIGGEEPPVGAATGIMTPRSGLWGDL
jgi:hypothetical protein